MARAQRTTAVARRKSHFRHLRWTASTSIIQRHTGPRPSRRRRYAAYLATRLFMMANG